MKILLSLLLVTTTLTSYAQEVLPGMIPRFYSIEAATDLPITPDQAHQKALAGFDISTLDPKPNSNIWKKSLSTISDVALLRPDETVRYVKTIKTRSGQIRFSVQTSNKRELIILLSKKAHNLLLRRNILNKVGYITPPMSWVPRIKIQFDDTIDRDLFKEDLTDKLVVGIDRWVKSEQDLTLSLQDAVVLTPESEIYNLTQGLMSADVHQGRRLLRAPYVPLALVDTTESVNLMPWQAGRVILNNVKLNHTLDLDTGYGTSWEDARWIGRRMMKLGRLDFEEIVAKAYFPTSVGKLLTEKLIARRNDLLEMLSLDTESTKLEFDPNVNFEKTLVDGEIVQEFFDGYASRFSYGDPESPFSSSELGSYALGRGQSQLISTAITQLNTLLGSDDQRNYEDDLISIIKKEGPFFSTQAIFVPTFHGSLILSRDIITGTYLGTNNKVQLVDNFGISLDAGVYAGVEGLPIPMTFKGGAGIDFQRVFSHIKPIKTLKKSMKEPYKNMMVPLLIKGLGDKIDKLSIAQGPQGDAMLATVVKELKDTLAVGESFIITDSIVPRVFTEAELSLSQLASLPRNLLKVYGRVQAERMMLTRFHLHRPNEDTFQVYQDYGKGLRLRLTLKLRSYVPIVAFNARWNVATSETKFFPIPMDSKSVSVGTLKALKQSLFSLDHSSLAEMVKPHKVENTIKEKANTFQFLVFKQNKIGSLQNMKLTHALGGKQKNIFRRYDAVTSGLDTESYATETVNYVLKMLLNRDDLALSDVMTLNPGFTVGGKAKNKVFTSEHDGERLSLSYQRILNGWKVPAKKIKGLLDTMNREVGRLIFNPINVTNTDSILLYQISFTYILTHEGTGRLLKSTDAQLKTALTKYSYRSITGEPAEIVSGFSRDLKKISTQFQDEDPSEGMKSLHGFLKRFQDNVTVKGLENLVGAENISYQGRIEGFRQGDENGDSAIFSNVYGELPIPLQTPPTQAVMNNWGILEGELLSNWMMERAI
jgi:hypothetical protein